MSWLSQFKNAVIASLTNAVPTDVQAPVHSAATGVATAINNLGVTLESAATSAVEGALVTHLGPAGGFLAYDFLTALINEATTRKAALATTPPSPIVVPASQPAQPPATITGQ